MGGLQSSDESVITGLQRIIKNYSKKTAMVYLGKKFSYANLNELVDRFATALYELGVRNNDKVMLYLSNSPQWIIGYLAVLKIGGVLVPTSPVYTPYEISYQIKHSGAETIICMDTNCGYVFSVLRDTCLKRVIVTNLGGSTSLVQTNRWQPF